MTNDISAPREAQTETLQNTLTDRIKAAQLAPELETELLQLVEDCGRMAATLQVYSDRRNWRREWFGQHKYNYVFAPKSVRVLDNTVEPDELMESVARQVG